MNELGYLNVQKCIVFVLTRIVRSEIKYKICLFMLIQMYLNFCVTQPMTCSFKKEETFFS